MRRLLVGPLSLACVVGIAMFAVNETVGAYATARTMAIEDHHFGLAERDDRYVGEGIFWPDLEDGWKCDVRNFDRRAFTGEHVFMYAIHADRHEQIHARKLTWDASQETWFLEEGTWSVFDARRNYAAQNESFTRMAAPFQASPDFLLTSEVHSATRSLGELAKLHDKHASQGYTARRLYLDMHTKIVNPLLCVSFLLLAVPFSVRLGRGAVSVGLSVAILLGLGYMIFAAIAHGMGYSGQLVPLVAAWLPFAVYLAGSVVLLGRTPT